MATPVRRRVLRARQQSEGQDNRRQLQVSRCRAQLEREREGLARWMTRLKRAFMLWSGCKIASPAWSVGSTAADRIVASLSPWAGVCILFRPII